MRIFDQALPDQELGLFSEIESRYFTGPLRADIKLEGQRIEDGEMALGCRAGPGITVWNLLHEMSHFVEIDDARMMMSGWGLHHGKIKHFHRSTWYEFKTSQCLRRELRVGAFQYNLGKALGYYTSQDEFVGNYSKTMRFMPFDALCKLASEENCYTPTDTNETGKVVDTEAACVKVLVDLLETDNYSYDAFNAEWHRKTSIIRTRNAPSVVKPV